MEVLLLVEPVDEAVPDRAGSFDATAAFPMSRSKHSVSRSVILNDSAPSLGVRVWRGLCVDLQSCRAAEAVLVSQACGLRGEGTSQPCDCALLIPLMTLIPSETL